ncbi:hypothetical protein QBC35DRAFT_540818 [Podospora australis]|uniref:ATP-dependent DNA helicase n=1 Tax=Podospora australis TaxID=1536484 RepID=A0AAN6WZS9_9PEZI|nr:hypothetical protein QBC35DRAFT_540818 [Podospora australis]
MLIQRDIEGHKGRSIPSSNAMRLSSKCITSAIPSCSFALRLAPVLPSYALNHPRSVLDRIAASHGKQSPIIRYTPTGGAANNINGSTIYATLRLPVSKGDIAPRSDTETMSLQLKLGQYQYFLIDEKSLLGLRHLQAIDQRLRQMIPQQPRLSFRGRSVILVGDFFQLPSCTPSPQTSQSFGYVGSKVCGERSHEDQSLMAYHIIRTSVEPVMEILATGELGVKYDRATLQAYILRGVSSYDPAWVKSLRMMLNTSVIVTREEARRRDRGRGCYVPLPPPQAATRRGYRD